MANVKQIVSAQLSQRQREINQQADRAALLDPDRLLCSIVRVDDNINVPSRPGFVWCQEYSPSDDTNPFHAFNDKVQAREGLSVWIAEGLGGRREVLDWNNATIVNTPIYKGQKYLPLHHSDHEWPDFKPGPDVVNVYPRSLSMLRTYPGEAGALTVSASPLRYVKGNALVVFPGKNSLDISASQPASGLARFVGIYLDPDDNTLKSVDGATTGDSPAITPDSPAFPESAILSANVRLNGDQTVFSEVDMVDVRQVLDASGAIDGVRVSKLVSPDGSVDPAISASNTEVVHNEGGLDLDFRLESDIDVNAFFMRGSDGNIGIGSSGPDAKLDILNASGAQLRMTHTDGTLFADFTLDASSDLTIKTAGAGQIKLQPTTDSVDFFQVLDADGGTPVLNVDSTNERVGIGTAAPGQLLEVQGANANIFINSTNNAGLIMNRSSTNRRNQVVLQTGAVDKWYVGLADSDDAGAGTEFFIGQGLGGAGADFWIETNGRIGIGLELPLAQLHIDQASTTAAIPVALFDQADVSEEMFEFVSTIGVGNAIEAVGAKTLTPTHFIKTTIPGGLTRYFAVGTIA